MTPDITITRLTDMLGPYGPVIELELSDRTRFRRLFAPGSPDFNPTLTTLRELFTRQADMDLASLYRLGMKWAGHVER